MSDDLKQGNLEYALRRMLSQINERSAVMATEQAAAVGVSVGNNATEGLAEHEAKRQFVHGVGPLFVAKTKNANQLVDWSEIQHKPDFGDLDFGDIEIDASQIISGIIALARLPVAALGETVANKLVRANDPRLTVTSITYPAGEPLSSGDFLRVADVSGTTKVFRAVASSSSGKAIGYTPESHGTDDTVTVFPYGENPLAFLPDAEPTDVGKTVFLSTTPGKGTLTPPNTAGVLIQPLGTLARVISSTVVAVLIRYEYRVVNAS